MSKNVHRRLRDVRKQVAKMSQTEMAEALSRETDEEPFVSPGSVGNYERGPESGTGTGKVPADYLERVCERFDISPAWLVAGEGPMMWGRDDLRAQRRAVIADYLERQLMKYAERKPTRLGPGSLVRHDRNGGEDGAASATP